MQTRRLLRVVAILATISAATALLWQGTAVGATPIGSPSYSQPTVWNLAGSPYVVSGKVRVLTGGSLTIQPGVVVKFQPNGSSAAIEASGGALIADGTEDQRIVFTSYRDDTVAGDTNGDGAATSPARGDWYHLWVKSGAFDHVDVRYGGWVDSIFTSEIQPADQYSGIWVGDGADITISNSRITDNKQNGIAVGEGKLTLSNSLVARNYRGVVNRQPTGNKGIEIDHSTIRDNDSFGLWNHIASSFTGSNVVHDSNVTRNGKQGIRVYTTANTPSAQVLHGNNNNVYDNQLGSATDNPRQLTITNYATATPRVDWTGNFWGQNVVHTGPAGTCPGRLQDNLGFGSLYPISTVSGSGCLRDAVPIGPGEFSQTYIANGAYDDYTGAEYGLMLQQHAPHLLYDTDDNYRADSPGTHANSPDTTLLVFVGGPSIQGPPWLEDLEATYFGMGTATESDLLDREPHGQEAALSQYAYMRTHHQDLLGRAYGRVTHDNAGRTLLQYWLFYFHQEPIETNPFAFEFGEHQGDWEMVTVRLDANLNPDRAFYAQHGVGGQYCDWPLVQHSLSTDQPDVYVAQTTHASYFSDGFHANNPQDISDGDGDSFVPAVTPVTDTDPAWMTWPGHWGGSQENIDLSTADSPPGPVFQTQWSGHDGWAAGLENACD